METSVEIYKDTKIKRKISKLSKLSNNIKHAQIFELIGESICGVASILYVVDASTNGSIKIYSVPILYLIGSILFLCGSVLMIIQSVLTIKKITK